MNIAPAIVFFIFIFAHPNQQGKAKAQMQWVLYGAPTQQLAGEWAQAEFAKQLHGYTIDRLLVLPMSDTMYTEEGPVVAPWTALPDADQVAPDLPSHDTFHIEAPNKKPAPPAGTTPHDERMKIQKSVNGSIDLNWNEGKPWYFIVYTAHQAVLVEDVNPLAASIPYTQLVRGTPAGDDNATIYSWCRLTLYHKPAPAALSPH